MQFHFPNLRRTMDRSIFSPYPVLHTSRFTLRQLHNDDAAAIYTLRSSEEVNKFIDRPRATSIDDALQFIQRIIQLNNTHQSFLWVLAHPGTNQLMGTIILWNLDDAHNTAEIGYEMLPAFQRRGYMKEAITAVLHFAFNELKVDEVQAWVHPDNEVSKLLALQTGFSFLQTADKEIRYEIFHVLKP